MSIYPTSTKVALPILDSANLITFTRGKKFFELSNHLDNVLTTLSDKKWGITLNGTTIDHFNPQVISANDYYPFGAQMQGRDTTFSGNAYRFGFNGKENDNLVKGVGDQQDYGMRIYDPRVGRFLSVDPVSNKYPEITPYQFSSNTPIEATDIDGLEKYIIHYRPHDGKDNIVKVVTKHDLKYMAIYTGTQPIKAQVVQFIKEDQSGHVLSVTGEIPLKNYGGTLYVGPLNPK
jgi:RHS repeat-associated protein